MWVGVETLFKGLDGDCDSKNCINECRCAMVVNAFP